MADDLKKILFGKTAKVILEDEKEYVLREPDIETLESVDFDLKNIDDIRNIEKLAWIMLREDNEGLTEKEVGKRITFSMLNQNSPFRKVLFGLLGTGEEKNVAGAAI